MNAGLLDCGHAPTVRLNESCGTGYGTDANGVTRCYECCAIAEKVAMMETGRATLYLVRRESADGKESDIFRRYVTNWPGSLSFVCTETRHYPRGGGFGSQRTDAWFRGPDGALWHAVNRGDNDLARCRRVKS